MARLLGQALQHSALVLVMLNPLHITTLSYWLVPRVSEAAVAFTSAMTPGVVPLVVNEVRHSCRLVAP
jgi:hypothetical protein